MLWARVYRRGKDTVLALADEELMGKSFEEGEFVLKVGKFYKGKLIDEKEAMELCKEATIINAVGERAVKVVLKAGLASERSIKRISNIPHIQVVFYFV